MKTPKWAETIYLDALTYLESKGHNPLIAPLSWRRGSTTFSSGHCKWNGKGITITAGKNRLDQKLVLLHETAHLIGSKTHEGHSPKFWDMAWDLYRHFKVPINYAKKREYSYKQQAKAAYRRNITPYKP